MKLGVFGTGRLGSALVEAAGPALAWQVGREAPPPDRVDAALEATVASQVEGRVAWALATGTNLLIGTTGWTLPDLESRVGQSIGVLVAPNFSLTVALYARLSLVLARYAALDEAIDPYLVEHHHARKHDAPSGTAKQLAGTLMKGCPRKREWVIPAAGSPVLPHQLNVSSIRAGYTYSSHVVGLDSPGEVVELSHAARSARPYAEGALRAARWLQGKKGVFTMDQVAADLLDPLFLEVQP
jgi:4-hydroxy-tetrahydrodipicolinate reductase